MESKCEYITMNFKELDGVKIPGFQRRLVWSKKSKAALISTIHEGFPFGNFLVGLKDSDDSLEYWQLLDGQQRLSTMRDFENNRLEYWKYINPNEYYKYQKEFNSCLEELNLKPVNDKKFDEIVNSLYKDFNDVVIPLGVGKDKPEDINKCRDKIEPMKEEIYDYVDLNKLEIPITKYIGDISNYPKIFNNLNRNGKRLSKYEIYNASWIDSKIKLDDSDDNCNAILDYVIDYYKDKEETGDFELATSVDEIIVDNTINLAELGTALGKLVVNKMPSLISSSKSSNTEEEMGFGILGIAADKKNNEIDELNNEDSLSFIQENCSDILQRACTISDKLNDTFKGLLEVRLGHSKSGTKNGYTTGLSTTFKILSYFADLWNKEERKQSDRLRRIPAYYLLDYLNDKWGAHGDSTLYHFYPSVGTDTYYDKKITKTSFKNKFKTSFSDWISSNKENRSGFSKQIKAIANIHANYFEKNAENSHGEDDQFEHIIPKARIKKYDINKKINGNSLGNCMVIPRYLNLDKQDLTLYEYEDKENNNIKFTELEKYSKYPSRKELNEIIDKLYEGDSDYINNYLLKRGNEVANSIIDELLKDFNKKSSK